ncbi:MAG TPA: hypothetical protein PLB24_11170 [Comamonas denitrificans]|jgi:hypothetical protein|nr:hypothetical protein [Comamonas denitrificans]
MAEYKMHADLLDWPTELQELRMLQAEALGWQPVAPGAYLHLAQPSAEGGAAAATADAAQVVAVIDVVGVPDAAMAGLNVLLLGW